MVEEQSAGAVDLSEFKDTISKKVLSRTKFFMDYPRKGINFMDLFSITGQPDLFKEVIDAFKYLIEMEVGKPGEAFTVLVGLESRGFVLGPILSLHWNLPFYPIRKAGKLPGEVVRSASYEKEYGKEEGVEIQAGVLLPGAKVLLIDDLLATGGTLQSAAEMIRTIEGVQVAASAVVFEIDALKGRTKVSHPITGLIHLKD